MLDLDEAVTLIKNCAEESRKYGQFLTSSLEISHYWIDINELLFPRIIEAMSLVLASFLKTQVLKGKLFSLIIPEFMPASSESTFPLRLIGDRAVESSDDLYGINLVYARSVTHSAGVQFEGGLLSKSLILAGMTVHIDMLERIIESMTMRGCNEIGVFAFFCRDTVSLHKLKTLGIEVSAAFVVDKQTRVISFKENHKLSHGDMQGLMIRWKN